MHINDLPNEIRDVVSRGCVIPAHPLALDDQRRFSESHQRGLTRYYCDAGAGGIAVGVHSTQFEIREPQFGLYQPVLSLAAETMDAWCTNRSMLKVAGVCGRTEQAVAEAAVAEALGYHACLLSLSAWKNVAVADIVAHCRAVAEVMPLWGFYLQPAAGGVLLPYEFWRRFAEIENVLAIKIAPFNRYQTLDVVRAVCDAGREHEIALYTGNDDTIVNDLLTPYRITSPDGQRQVRIVGGLLGHWCVWTLRAVEQLARIHALMESNADVPADMLTLAIEVTDSNAAFFDSANNFAGCLSGINESLRRRGQVPSAVCLNPQEQLSHGQSEELDRVQAAYPHLNDDAFVAENLDRWLA